MASKITNKDLDQMAIRSLAEQCCFSFERMQAVGFCYGMTKCFRKIHGDNNQEMAAAMQNNLDFINTEPHMAAILQGLIVSMEEAGQDRTLIHSLKAGLFGPLAGLGDAYLVVHGYAHRGVHLLLPGQPEQCAGPHFLHALLGGYRYCQSYLVCAHGLQSRCQLH